VEALRRELREEIGRLGKRIDGLSREPLARLEQVLLALS
jgi:8-oxo-dGTP pyrophosphatase MutT (NUDIX family)